MAFKFVKSLSGENFPLLHSAPTKASSEIPADAALALIAGKVSLATGSTKPHFIAAGAVASAENPADAPVQDVLSQFVWETSFSADAAAVKLGDKVTLHTDGLQVTASTAAGVATVLCMFGTAAGSLVWVRFE